MTGERQGPPSPLALLRALRPDQWTKNGVVLAAFFFALGDHYQSVAVSALLRALAATAVFCAASSAIYLVNDVRDAAADRLHPTKRFRPVAAGLVSAPLALAMSAALAVCAATGALRLSGRFAAVIAAYMLMQVAYTFVLKRVALVDVFIIAFGFVLRAAAGGLALNVLISPWLLLCAFLLALFLALCKRRHEKLSLEDHADAHRASLGGYDARLLDQLIGIVSAAVIVCYAIYTLWPETVHKFGTSMLSLTVPFVMFGVFRYLDLVYRHERGGRPERILLSDLPLIIDLALYGATVLAVFTWAR